MSTNNEPANGIPWARLLYSPLGKEETLVDNALPDESILKSYQNQWYRLKLDGVEYGD